MLSTKSGSTHTELVCARNSVNYILSAVLGRVIRLVQSLSNTHTQSWRVVSNFVNYILSAVLGRVIGWVHSLSNTHIQSWRVVLTWWTTSFLVYWVVYDLFHYLCIPFLILSVYYREKVQLTALSIDLSIYISVYYREKVQLTACKELVASLIKSINILEQG